MTALSRRMPSRFGRSRQAVTRRFGMTRLEPVDRRVAPQQGVAVVLTNVVEGEFLFRIPGVVIREIPMVAALRSAMSRAVV